MPGLQRRRTLDLDVKAYGRWLLDWLYDQPESKQVAKLAPLKAASDPHLPNALYGIGLTGTGPFFTGLGLPGITGHPVVAYLDGQRWADPRGQLGSWHPAHDILGDEGFDPMQQDVESPPVIITFEGLDVAQGNRASCRDAVPADTPLTGRLLRWVYRVSMSTGRPANLVNFLPSDYATRNRTLGFTLGEAQDTALWLHEKELVTDPGSQPARGLGQQLVELMPDGRECHNGYDADVSRYLRRGCP